MSQLIPSLIRKHGPGSTAAYIRRRYPRRFVGWRGEAVLVHTADPSLGVQVLHESGDTQWVAFDDPELDLDTRYAGYYPDEYWGLLYYRSPRSYYLGIQTAPQIWVRRWLADATLDVGPLHGLGKFMNEWAESARLLKPEFRHSPLGKYGRDVEIYHRSYARVGKQMFGPRFRYLGEIGGELTDPVALHYLNVSQEKEYGT